MGGFRGAPRRPRGKGLPACGGAGDPRVKPRHLRLGAAARSDRNADHPKMGVSAAIGGVPRRFPRQRDAEPQRGWRSPRQAGCGWLGGSAPADRPVDRRGRRSRGPPVGKGMGGFRGPPRRSRGRGLSACGVAGDPRVKPRHLELGPAARSDRSADHPEMGVSAAIGGVPRRFPRQRDAEPQRGWRSPRQAGCGWLGRSAPVDRPVDRRGRRSRGPPVGRGMGGLRGTPRRSRGKGLSVRRGAGNPRVNRGAADGGAVQVVCAPRTFHCLPAGRQRPSETR